MIRDLTCYLTKGNSELIPDALVDFSIAHTHPGISDPNLISPPIAMLGSSKSGSYTYCFAPKKEQLAGLLNGTDYQLNLTWKSVGSPADQLTAHLLVTSWSIYLD
jgi:hypothetical protein